MRASDDPKFREVYVSPKGSKFVILPEGNLFIIHMENGGVRPAVTQQRYTTFKRAKQTLDRYFNNNPKPVERVPKQKEA